MSDADLRYTIEEVQRSVASLEGKVQSMHGRINSMEDRLIKMTDLVKHSLEFNATQAADLRALMSSMESHMSGILKSLDVSTEQQGRLLRQYAELAR